PSCSVAITADDRLRRARILTGVRESARHFRPFLTSHVARLRRRVLPVERRRAASSVIESASVRRERRRSLGRFLRPLSHQIGNDLSRWLEIADPRVRIVLVVGERLVVAKKVLEVVNRNREADRLAAEDLHVRDADDLALVVEERAAAVPRIDRRGRLDVEEAVDRAVAIADDSLRDGSLEPERTSDREHRIAETDILVAPEVGSLEAHAFTVLELEEREIEVGIERDDAHLLLLRLLEPL